MPDRDYYAETRYWNALPEVVRHLNRRATGDADTHWVQRFTAETRPFRKGLFLNCGNGWVERHFVEQGIVAEGVGVDISDDSLGEARAAAAGLPLRYYAMDTNDTAFPEDGYDLVVNFAACHHLAFMDRVLRAVCALLPPDGMLVAEDYVGPHRNQYDVVAWNAAYEVNQDLPERFRAELTYPHLPTFLVDDPTEAIHSELVMDTTRRYFDLDVFRPLGGAVAYPLLTFNDAIHQASENDRRDAVKAVLDADEVFTEAHPESTLFAVFWGRPRHDVLHDRERLARWTAEEDEREARAAANGGRYYRPTMLQDLTERVSDLGLAVEHLRATVAELQGQRAKPRWRRR